MSDNINEKPEYFVGIKFPGTSKSYFFSTNDNTLEIGDNVIVETVAGYELGQVSAEVKELSLYRNNLALKPVIRRPNQHDMDNFCFYEKEAIRALEITQKEVDNLGLPMNLLDAKYTLDGSRITITYTSDNRVDFRELLRNLAPKLHCRIELRQIASRDKAKMIGGIGICGLPLCCSRFLKEFEGISISRAKNQMLTLNIPKLSGPCGKLICCLLYEDELYAQAKSKFSETNAKITIDGVEYTVNSINILSETIKLDSRLDNRVISLEEFNKLLKKKDTNQNRNQQKPYKKRKKKHDKRR